MNPTGRGLSEILPLNLAARKATFNKTAGEGSMINDQWSMINGNE
jgi:hypothetical protein